MEIGLETGRKHQIRVQLSKVGLPIIGDRKYGSQVPFPSGIALHANEIELKHPVRDEILQFVAPLPNSWKQSSSARYFVTKMSERGS